MSFYQISYKAVSYQSDAVQVEQLIRGSTSDVMLLQLKVRERKNDLPTFLTLLQEICEEQRQFARQSLGTPIRRQHVRTVQAEKEMEPELTRRSELKAQIEELKAKMNERTSRHLSIPQVVQRKRKNRKMSNIVKYSHLNNK